MNFEAISNSPQFQDFKDKAHDTLQNAIMKKIEQECENSFIQIAIEKYKRLEPV